LEIETSLSGGTVIFAASPRAGGNSDAAAAALARAGAGSGRPAELLHLRDFRILPCSSCGHCASDAAGRCALAGADDAEKLFAKLMGAAEVFMASPIYFYHLPAGFKAWIDRAQSYFLRKTRGDEELLSLPERQARVFLVAGRPVGEKLFNGSLLTLKYFLEPFNITIGETLTLRGYDEKGALEADPEAMQKVAELGR
jgi:multimeric flavodoxin WrbA